MPDLDYAILCDYVRADGGLAHIIAAGIDTIRAAEVPTGHHMGVALRLLFTRNECDRAHRFEVIIQDEDGERMAALSGDVTPQWPQDQPVHWKAGAQAAITFRASLPRFGFYSVDILVNDDHKKSLPFRVVERAQPA